MSETMRKYVNFYRNYFQLFEAIDLCVKQNYILPSLCRIYSGIDTISWVVFGDIAVKERFVKFVENHMYKEKKLGPAPIDIYAARCAVLHTMTPDSDLSTQNKAVPLNYAWGNANLEELKKSVQSINFGEVSCVHLNELVESFRLGVANFIETNGSDSECLARMKKHYVGLSPEVVSKFNSTNA